MIRLETAIAAEYRANMSDSEDVRSSSPEPVSKTEKKKRKHAVASGDELEIDVNLPEPPSKKAKRKEKKSKSKPVAAESANAEDGEDRPAEPTAASVKAAPGGQTEARSDYGIWIGNLPWSATKETLRKFFEDHGGIDEKSITRVHMPPPVDRGPTRGPVKPQNKGFAYVDFVGPAELELALALSEKLMVGRRVLIKHAKSFEGRPEPSKDGGDHKKGSPLNGKEPSKRIFVGNLGFDITREDLEEHFGQAGQVEDVHMATFQDTGKCKGFAWVRFVELEAAELAVKGFVWKKNEDVGSDAEEDDEVKSESSSEDEEKPAKPSKKKRKQRKQSKWFINRLHGRPIRCEFAEDAQTRYKKRYGKAPPAANGAPYAAAGAEGDSTAMDASPQGRVDYSEPKPRKPNADQRQEMRRKKHQDARNIAPAKALANAQRASTAIVAPAGKKTTFD